MVTSKDCLLFPIYIILLFKGTKLDIVLLSVHAMVQKCYFQAQPLNMHYLQAWPMKMSQNSLPITVHWDETTFMSLGASPKFPST